MKKRIFRYVSLLLVVALCLSLSGCGSETSTSNENSLASQYPSFKVTTTDMKNGVWKKVVSKTAKGKNQSPQLTWEPVEGAGSYVIYMVDSTASYWMHWKSGEITTTSLERGAATAKEYVGPYPPDGSTHSYDIYIFALKNSVEKITGMFDCSNSFFTKDIEKLDTDADGNTGNILACGYISGKFSSK